MACETFVIVIDTPSIKNYVFGTDPLNEIRGASARLDELNRSEMQQCLVNRLGVDHVKRVYANGGSAQFLIHKSEDDVKAACKSMVQRIREQTGGEVGVVYWHCAAQRGSCLSGCCAHGTFSAARAA